MPKINFQILSILGALSLMMIGSPTFAAGTEMMINGGFSSGVASWSLGVYGGAASTGQVVNGEYVNTITKAGTQPWHVQLTQGALLLQQGKSYTLSFKARAAAARNLEVNIGQSGTPYVSYVGNFNVALTTTMQLFTKTFTMSSATDNAARVEFNSGLAAVNWVLDDVSLMEAATPGPFDAAVTVTDIPGTGALDPASGRTVSLTSSSGPAPVTPKSTVSSWLGSLGKSIGGAIGNAYQSVKPTFSTISNTWTNVVNGVVENGLAAYPPVQFAVPGPYTPTSVQAGTGNWVEGVNTETGRFSYSLPLGVVNGTGGLSWSLGLNYFTPPPTALNQSVQMNPTSGVGYGWSFQLPFIVTNHKGTTDYSDDEFVANLGPYGSGKLTTWDGSNFTLNSNPTVMIKALQGSNVLNFLGWKITFPDGTTLVLGGRDDAIRKQLCVGDHVLGSFWQGADANTYAGFAYRWDISEIRAPQNRGILRFAWNKVKSKSLAYDVESQIASIWSSSPFFTVVNDLAQFTGTEQVLEKATLDWQLKGADEVFATGVAANLFPDARIFVDSRYLNKVIFNQGGQDVFNYQLQYIVKRPVVQTETIARRYLAGALPTYQGLAPEKEQWWFSYDDATGWMKTITSPTRTQTTIGVASLGRTLQVDQEDNAYTGSFTGQNSSFCAGEFCYDMERGKWPVTENGATVCPAADGIDFRVYQKVGPSFKKVLDREFWKALGKCPPTQIYPSSNYFAATWGQGKSGATTFDRLTIFKWNGTSFTEVNPFANDPYHANLPVKKVNVSEDWMIVGLQRPNSIVEYVPLVSDWEGIWKSLNRSATTCDASLSGAGSVAYPAGTGVSTGNGCIAFSNANGYPSVQISGEFINIHSNDGAFAVFRKNRTSFENISYRIRGPLVNNVEIHPWDAAWAGKIKAFWSGDNWIAADYAPTNGVLRLSFWRWNGNNWAYSEPFAMTGNPSSEKAFPAPNGFISESSNDPAGMVSVGRVAFPKIGGTVTAKNMSATLPGGANGAWPAGSYSNPSVTASQSLTAIQMNFTSDWPYPMYDPVANNRYYSFLFRDGVDVSSALVDPMNAPYGLFDLQIGPDEKWLIGKTASNYYGIAKKDMVGSLDEHYYLVPISNDRSAPNLGIGGPATWTQLTGSVASRSSVDGVFYSSRLSLSDGGWVLTDNLRRPYFYPMTLSGPSKGILPFGSNELNVVTSITTSSLRPGTTSKQGVAQTSQFYYGSNSAIYDGTFLSPVAIYSTITHPNSGGASLDQLTNEYWTFQAAKTMSQYVHPSLKEATGYLSKSTSIGPDGTQTVAVPEYRNDVWNGTTHSETTVFSAFRTTEQTIKGGATLTKTKESGLFDGISGKPVSSALKIGGITSDYGEGVQFRHAVMAWNFNPAGMPLLEYRALYKNTLDVNNLLANGNAYKQMQTDCLAGKCLLQSASENTFASNNIDLIKQRVWGLGTMNVDATKFTTGQVAAPKSLAEGWSDVSNINVNRAVSGSVLEATTQMGTNSPQSKVTVYEGNMVLPTIAFSGSSLANCAGISAEDGVVGLNNNYENGTVSPTGPRWEIDPTKVTFDKTLSHSGQYSFKVTDSYGPTRNLYLTESPDLANGVEVSAWVYSTGAMPHISLQKWNGTTIINSYDALPDNAATAAAGFKANRWQFWRVRIPKSAVTDVINPAIGGTKKTRVFFGTMNLSGGNTIWVDDLLISPVSAGAVITGYDARGRAVSATTKDGITATTEYDARGRVQSVRDHRGRISSESSVIPAGEN